jgi:hypothetical protein
LVSRLTAVFCLALLGAGVVWTTAHAAAASGGYVVLVNHNNPAATLTRPELKRLATGGKKQWDNGAVVQLGIIPNDAAETQFLASLLSMSSRELLERIQEQVFKGELRRPAVLRSSADCVAFARASAGALCVASDSESIPPDANVVAIR